MRQAGRYMASFREYSTTIGFRERSETPDIATELSLQPWRAFGVDGVIMFSDILTPLPALVTQTVREGHTLVGGSPHAQSSEAATARSAVAAPEAAHSCPSAAATRAATPSPRGPHASRRGATDEP